MPRPPDWFSVALAALDSYLSVRWGDASNTWVIQRKSYIPPSELEYWMRTEGRLRALAFSPPPDASERKIFHDRQNWTSCAEELASAHGGSRVIFMTKVLNDDVFKRLCQTDIQRYQGYARFADEMEKEEAAAEIERERITDNKRKALDGEVHDILRFLARRRSTELENKETDLRKLLHGRRTTEDDGELMPLKEF